MTGVLAVDIADVDLYDAYAVPDGRVHVRANFVTSLDGASTLAGVSEGLSGPADKRVFGVLRTLADVVLVGAGTARAEGYGPVKQGEQRRAWRLAHGRSAVPPVAVVSGSLSLDPSSELFTAATARPLVYTCDAAPGDRRRALEHVADVVVAGDRTVDVEEVVADLAVRGLRRVLCEGGPTLLAELVATDLLDELCLTVAPLLVGAGERALTGDYALAVPMRMRPAHVLTGDGFLFLRHVRATPEGS